MFSNHKDKVAYYQQQYDDLQKIFSGFTKLLTQGNSFGVKFKTIDNKTVNSEFCNESIEISFTFSLGQDPKHGSFGKLDFSKVTSSKIKDEKKSFWHQFFDDCGNIYDEIGESAHTYTITKPEGVNHVVTLMLNNFLDVFLIRWEEAEKASE